MIIGVLIFLVILVFLAIVAAIGVIKIAVGIIFAIGLGVLFISIISYAVGGIGGLLLAAIALAACARYFLFDSNQEAPPSLDDIPCPCRSGLMYTECHGLAIKK